ncbi:MAG: 2-C-methyl-D-erythritol 4-phosphate cytidylyltransferase [Thalassotalea sp.]
MSLPATTLAVVIPAAGIGKRMQANCPKQYLSINNKTVLEHTVERILAHPQVAVVVLALGANDEYFQQTALVNNPKVITVFGGQERVDSVLAGLKALANKNYDWVMVHDAARPCVRHRDISLLIDTCLEHQCGGLLASPVRDTMKQLDNSVNRSETPPLNLVGNTVDRSQLWHAYTPQMYPLAALTSAIENGLQRGVVITDESSAIEAAGDKSQLIEGCSDNIKITRAEDLALAEFILNQQIKEQEITCE